jgi:hypothetical protein
MPPEVRTREERLDYPLSGTVTTMGIITTGDNFSFQLQYLLTQGSLILIQQDRGCSLSLGSS